MSLRIAFSCVVGCGSGRRRAAAGLRIRCGAQVLCRPCPAWRESGCGVREVRNEIRVRDPL
ncbi:hypothetical protein L505_2960 [Bordetella bronchiseptica F4563]|nr:hypothetical protein L505_2960 [Bordetella bronchiseptica F4563]KDD43097.1 hypothetical protein L529_2816 [Bordetella bronchiseptica MBORD901]